MVQWQSLNTFMIKFSECQLCEVEHLNTKRFSGNRCKSNVRIANRGSQKTVTEDLAVPKKKAPNDATRSD